ncbi:hypothetical protein GQ600_4228 [Phytophthora cactorum]|nr:hypothetical protein GQ600_4228 [Phytophthora cactorum]
MGTQFTAIEPPVAEDHGATDADGDVAYTASHASLHFNQNNVDFINKLSNPISDQLEPLRPFTHIYVVCCDENMSRDRIYCVKSYIMRQ